MNEENSVNDAEKCEINGVSQEIEQSTLATKSGKDLYAYLDRNEFSSERYKIVIKNLPKYYGAKEMRKLLNEKLKLASNKIKFLKKNSPIIFVCFRSDEDRKNAIQTINGFKWKGNLLEANIANPAPDPLAKRRHEENDQQDGNKKIKLSEQTQEEQLKCSTTPLWNVPYNDQLKMKQEEIKKLLKTFGNTLSRQNPNLKKYLDKQKSLYSDLPCEVLDIRHSDVLNGYRNKCEFTVGEDEETNMATVGFRIGSYTTGKVGVAPVHNLTHISEKMKTVAAIFQNFVRVSNLKVFNPEHQTGHFRQLTVRCSSNQLMLIVGIHPQDLTEQELQKLKDDLIDYFFEGPGQTAKVTSLFYQAIIKKKNDSDVSLTQHLKGDTYITEDILGLKFRISPEAFFQINTSAAQILYSSAIELAQPQQTSTIVDVCCGTGTIGLCFAKHCNQVLGIELIPQAVKDAKENAKSNNIENCEFFDGKAEDILNSVLYRAKNEDIIAIVDPPRAGLHIKCIANLRKAEKISKLVYISCNPKAAMKNFIDLGKPESKTMFGEPFVPRKAVAVDMFPHTNHCELLIYFERWNKERFNDEGVLF